MFQAISIMTRPGTIKIFNMTLLWLHVMWNCNQIGFVTLSDSVLTQGTAIFKSVLNVFDFTNVILQNMYVRIQASFLCKCKLAVNV